MRVQSVWWLLCTHTSTLTTHSFFSDLFTSLLLFLSMFARVCSRKLADVFIFQHLLLWFPWKLFAFYSNWMNFDFFYLLFFLWFHFICSMLCYHRLLVFFSFRLCSLFSFFVPYWLYALQVNEIKNLQWKVKREKKKKVSRKWTTNILDDGIHPKSVWCLMMIIQNMCTCCWLQEISSKHYTIRGHTKSTNASNQNQNQNQPI